MDSDMKQEEFYDENDYDIEIVEVDDYVDNEIEEADDLEEEEFDDELEDFEEEEPQPFMIAIISLGVVIAILIIACVIIFFFKSEKEDTLIDAEMIETETIETETIETEVETEVDAEDQTVIESIVEETQNDVIVEEKEDSENEEQAAGEETQQKVGEVAQSEPISGNESMEFAEINDTVTAKDVTNLRSIPSTLDEANVVSQLKNGEVLTRTGVNEAYGWSRLDYNGQIVYAVSNYLTTDLDYKTPVTPSDPNRVSTKDGRVIIFTDYSDNITPKEYVNLRTEPSTSEGESTVRCQIKSGDVVHRTGYSPDSGWSRVEYNGEVLYVVSSMIYTTE